MRKFYWVQLDGKDEWVIAEKQDLGRWFICGIDYVMNEKSIGKNGSITKVGSEVHCPYTIAYEGILNEDVFTFIGMKAKEKEMNNTTNKDNWKDKATGMVCSTCTNYAPKNEFIGRCRRNAPTMKGFPAVFPTDWCGEHKMNDALVAERKKNAAV
jgi:uncharacterized protein RhaS with RHS repeats